MGFTATRGHVLHHSGPGARGRILFTPKTKQQPTKGHLTNMATSCCHTGSLVETVEIHVLLPATKQMDLRLTPTAGKDSNHLCTKWNDIMWPTVTTRIHGDVAGDYVKCSSGTIKPAPFVWKWLNALMWKMPMNQLKWGKKARRSRQLRILR